MRRLVLILAVLTLAACSGRPSGVPERDLQWRTSLRGGELQVIVFDRTGAYRIDNVALVGPGGQTVMAREMTRESQGGSGSGPGYSVFGSGGTRGGMLGAGLDMPVGPDPVSLERRTSAFVPLPPGYRQNVAQWHIEIEMTLPRGGLYRASIAAPSS